MFENALTRYPTRPKAASLRFAEKWLNFITTGRLMVKSKETTRLVCKG
jgi:hypothetical protein